jgi:hypothetical protein
MDRRVAFSKRTACQANGKSRGMFGSFDESFRQFFEGLENRKNVEIAPRISSSPDSYGTIGRFSGGKMNLARVLQFSFSVRARCLYNHGEGGVRERIGTHLGSPSQCFSIPNGFSTLCMVYIGERCPSGAHGKATVPEMGFDPPRARCRTTAWDGLAKGWRITHFARSARSEDSVANPCHDCLSGGGDPFP